MTKLITLLGLIFLLQSCGYSVHQMHASDFSLPMNTKAQVVEAQGEQFAILGFVFNTDYVNSAYHSMQKKCTGQIDGLMTKSYTQLGFFSWYNRVELRGYCIH